MKIDKDTVDKIAHLARLELNEAEKQKAIVELSEILSFMAKLDELDTTGVQPLVYMNDAVNVLRPDEVRQEITTAEALLNAPLSDGTYFKVAKVIER
ncbi:MAG: Asp-tRNA(Asn)/Glu-tRNA(Gln) amidotransferase subunit GatC [Sphingobacteriales bacterium]|nr:MAG: Asp-tRNA(Asn)/Glu-tRNA(Gln) amidotransferase subunit GatC [Sphingobacteriales bacterium]TAF79967.1 MAG: Asp-tRNA(Asn)/Glu-tRNA(Gln) amidotransferase subunit GatC [Sphingobacteriales bacterium]